MVVGWNLEAVSNPLNDERTVAGRSADGANGKIRSGPAQTCSGHWRGNFSGLGISGIVYRVDGVDVAQETDRN